MAHRFPWIATVLVTLLASIASAQLGATKADLESHFVEPQPSYGKLDSFWLRDFGIESTRYRPLSYEYRRVTFGFRYDKVVLSQAHYYSTGRERLTWQGTSGSFTAAATAASNRRC